MRIQRARQTVGDAGDEVTAGSVSLQSLADLETVLYGYEPGDRVEIVIYRSGRQYSGTITVGEAN
mgnify:CR=1 FL=1